MERSFIRRAEQMKRRHHRRSNRRKIFTGMASVVVFITVYMLILPAITMARKPECGLEVHTHTGECYENTLVCGMDEQEGHTHSLACLPAGCEPYGDPVCGMAHAHSLLCYAYLRIPQNENAGSPDGAAPVSADAPAETIAPEPPESADSAGEKEELPPPPAETEPPAEETPEEPGGYVVLPIQSCFVCGMDESAGHSHTESCYEKTLICPLEEHEHTDACYPDRASDPNAVESRGTWEASLPEELSGIWAEDIVAVAESQLGYRESTVNFVVSTDGESYQGYTRYGDWYGYPHGDWCAMFVSFCMHYAGIPAEAVPYNAGCTTWIKELEEYDLYLPAGEYTPSAGDIIFFDQNLDGASDHVGLVAAQEKNEVRTIEGNNGDAVGSFTYALDDSTILGYCELSQIQPLGVDMLMDEIATSEQLIAAIEASKETPAEPIVLGANFKIDANIDITGTVTLDLNGHTLNAGGNKFIVAEGDSLTIKDSVASNESDVADEGVATNAQNAGKLAMYDNDILTYYVTETNSINDLGATKETLVKHTVKIGGKIIGANIDVQGGGEFTLESGALCRAEKYAITANGGTVNLDGGYICGSVAGGGVDANGAEINLSGTVIAGNSAEKGAGISLLRSTLNITGGVISGNDASEFGAGIYCETSTITMTGGYVTNNVVADAINDINIGGGGVYLKGPGDSVLNLNGGYITGNKASTGGGISTYNADNLYDHKMRLNMTGGFVSGNFATMHEGGGMALRAQSRANITAGYITNNRSDSSSDWGGGGIFCSEQGTVKLMNSLIADNSAGGFGGGVAGCSTGTVLIQVEDGAAIFGNKADGVNLTEASNKKDDWLAHEDKVFMHNGFDDYFCAKTSAVYDKMLGGGVVNWTGSADSVPVGPEDFDPYVTSVERMGLDAHPDSDAQQAAISAAKVYINGNYARNHGGGLLCNGLMMFGSTDEPFEFPGSLTLNAKKALDGNFDNQALKDYTFDFVLMDSEYKEIATAQNDENGLITFPSIKFDKVGTYTFYLKELTTNYPTIIKDEREYKIVVEVKEKTVTDAGSNIYKAIYPETITMYEGNTQRVSVSNWGMDADYSVNLFKEEFKYNFNNTFADKISISVEKKWADENGNPIEHPADIDSVTVYLTKNGKRYESTDEARLSPVELNSENNWVYEWKDLPCKDDDGPIRWNIEEDGVAGWTPSYTYGKPGETEPDPGEPEQPSGPEPVTNPVPGTEYYLATGDATRYMILRYGAINIITMDALQSEGVNPRYIVELGENNSIYIKNIALANYMGCTGESWEPIAFRQSEKNDKAKFYLDEEGFIKVPVIDNGSVTGEYRYLSFFIQDGNTKVGLSDSSDNAFRFYNIPDKPGGGDNPGGGTSNDTLVTITNRPYTQPTSFEFDVLKVDADSNNTYLAGAEFELKNDKGETLNFNGEAGSYVYVVNGGSPTLVTGADGTLHLSGLPAGDYTLVETKAPEGYETPQGDEAKHKVTLGPDASGTPIKITVENHLLVYELPETGGSGTQLYTMAGLLLCGTAYVMYRTRKRRKEGHSS